MHSCTDASPENGTAAYVKGFVNASNASSNIVLDANMSRLDVNEYIKTEANEYMKVTAISGDGSVAGVMLTVERGAHPPGLSPGLVSAVPNRSSLALDLHIIQARTRSRKRAHSFTQVPHGSLVTLAEGGTGVNGTVVSFLFRLDETWKHDFCTRMHTLQHTLTQAQRTRTLAQVKLVAAIANLDVDEYIKTASNEYLKVTIRSANTIYATLCVYMCVCV